MKQIFKEDPSYFDCERCKESFSLSYSMVIGYNDKGSDVLICPYCQDDFVEAEDQLAFKKRCGVLVKEYYE